MRASERPAGVEPGEASETQMQTHDLTPPRTAQLEPREDLSLLRSAFVRIFARSIGGKRWPLVLADAADLPMAEPELTDTVRRIVDGYECRHGAYAASKLLEDLTAGMTFLTAIERLRLAYHAGDIREMHRALEALFGVRR